MQSGPVCGWYAVRNSDRKTENEGRHSIGHIFVGRCLSGLWFVCGVWSSKRARRHPLSDHLLTKVAHHDDVPRRRRTACGPSKNKPVCIPSVELVYIVTMLHARWTHINISVQMKLRNDVWLSVHSLQATAHPDHRRCEFAALACARRCLSMANYNQVHISPLFVFRSNALHAALHRRRCDRE